MISLEKRRNRPRTPAAVLGAFGLFLLLIVSMPVSGQQNSVESFSVSSRTAPRQGGVGTIEVVFLYRFAREIQEGDLKSVRLVGSEIDLAPAIRKAGSWDRPSGSQMRLIVPLPEILALGAAFADGSPVISFSTQINLAGQRTQRATVAYDFVAREERRARPELIGGGPPSATGTQQRNPPGKSAATQAERSSAGPAQVPPRPKTGPRAVSLPRILDQRTSEVGPGGGTVSLPSGARVEVPPGALAKAAAITLRRLESGQDDMTLYSIEAGNTPLAVPARLAFPVPSSPGNPTLAVDILHFHGAGDKVTLLPADWRPGDKEVTCRAGEFSLIGVIICTAPYIYALGREATIRMLSNTPENFKLHVEAALHTATHKSVLLRSVGYNQFPPETMWCWASSLSALLHTTRPLDKHLADPLKPQSMAALYGYNRSGYWRTGPSSTEWLSDNSALLTMLRSKSGASVEARCFTRFAALAAYLILQIDQGYPVTLDNHSKTHMLNVVGYDQLGPWIHDPAVLEQPYHASWDSFFTVVNQGLASFINNYVLTTVIQRDVSSLPPPFAINLPSCEFNAASSAQINRMGLYFTLPGRGAHAGFKWDGQAERHGMRLVAGQPGGPGEEPIEELLVGEKTRIGVKAVEVTNSTKDKIPGSIRLELMDGRTRRTVAVAKQDISMENEKISRHDLPETALFPLVQQGLPPSGSMLARTVLTVNGEDKDLVPAVFKYRLYSLSSASAIPAEKPGESKITLTGSGLSRGEMELIIEVPKRESAAVPVPLTDSDTQKTVIVGLSVPELREAAVYLRLLSRSPTDEGPGYFARAGLETNRTPIITGGSLKEVSTADDPVRYIPPPPKDPIKKN